MQINLAYLESFLFHSKIPSFVQLSYKEHQPIFLPNPTSLLDSGWVSHLSQIHLGGNNPIHFHPTIPIYLLLLTYGPLSRMFFHENDASFLMKGGNVQIEPWTPQGNAMKGVWLQFCDNILLPGTMTNAQVSVYSIFVRLLHNVADT